MDNSNNYNNQNISRDVYATNDAHAKRDVYSQRNPYEKNGKEKDEKILSKYGYGFYCDHFFNVENIFRTKFTDDTQIHTERRDYTGTGDIASVFPKMSLITAGNYFLIILIVISGSISMFLYDKTWIKISFITILIFIYAWRFFCPTYLILNAKQYVIGDEYKQLYRAYYTFVKLFEIVNLFISLFLIYISFHQHKSIIYLTKEAINYIATNTTLFSKYFLMLKQKQIHFEGFQYLSITYFLITLSSVIFFFYFKKNVIEKKYYENLKDIKLKRLANLYQRKALILNGM